VDDGVILELPYGVSGFAHNHSLVKLNGERPDIGEILDFQVVELSKINRRIYLSHSLTFSKAKQAKE
jgi:small subunit ribosomal protein S1